MLSLEEIKVEAIVQRLKHYEGNRTKTAASLDISIRGLRNMLYLAETYGHIIREGKCGPEAREKIVNEKYKDLRPSLRP